MDTTGDGQRSAGRFATTSALGLTGAVAGGTGLAVLAWLLAGPLVMLDRSVATAANAVVAPRPMLVTTLQIVTTLGDTLTAVIVLATLTVALLVRGRHRLALYVTVAALGWTALVPAVKTLVGRLRPVVDAPIVIAPGPSFPSGHTVAATVWIGVVLLVALPAVPVRARRPAIATGVLLVVAVGLTRILLGVHFLTDVLAGWLLGTAWLGVTAVAFRSWLRADGRAVAPLEAGLDPSAAPDLAPAPDHEPRSTAPWTACATQLLVVAVLLLGLITGVGWLITRTPAGDGVEATDVAVVRWFAEHRTAELDALSFPAGELGNTGVVIVLGLVVAVLGLAVTRRVRPVVLLAVALVGELALFMSSAGIVQRPRPPVQSLDVLPPTTSFPSGHTGAALCLYGAVAVLVLGLTRAWWRWLVVAAAVVAVVLVALARLYRGAHHPTDVLGSLLLGLPWLLATAYVLQVQVGRLATAASPRRRLAAHRSLPSGEITSRSVNRTPEPH